MNVGLPMSGMGSPQGTGRRGAMNLMKGIARKLQGWRRWPWEWLCYGPGMRRRPPQEQGTQQGTGQPARAVRLSYVDGQVKLSQGNQVLAEQAVANTPLL